MKTPSPLSNLAFKAFLTRQINPHMQNPFENPLTQSSGPKKLNYIF